MNVREIPSPRERYGCSSALSQRERGRAGRFALVHFEKNFEIWAASCKMGGEQFSHTHFFREHFLDDSVGHNCGVFGAYNVPDAAQCTYFGLFALQHRGQESAGIVVSDGKKVDSRKGMGLVTEVFPKSELAKLPGHIAVGHVRYSTTGSSRPQNIQPLVVDYSKGLLAIGHNGNLVNAQALRHELEALGSIFQTSTDSEVLPHLMAVGLGQR